ncbi:hypothetical protein RRK67_004036 [Vibrio fluvialis]|nr:hypothetical protein [Vibrio fluvialis]
MNKLKEFLARFFSPNDDIEFDDQSKLELNSTVNKRNTILSTIFILVLIAACGIYIYGNMSKKVKVGSDSKQNQNIDFGQVVDSQFANEDAQSAEKYNATEIYSLKEGYASINKAVDDLKGKLNQSLKEQVEMSKLVDRLNKEKSNLETELAVLQETFSVSAQNKNADLSSTDNQFGTTDSGNGFNPKQQWNSSRDTYIGQNASPRYVDEPEIEQRENVDRRYISPQSDTPTASIESFSFVTAKDESFKPTWKNYVPTGSWVTAVMTGGAEANAGVSGESNTSPVTFTMLNDGFLPNGKKSILKGCSMTGSAHGDISSQRGIVRGDRFSCVRKDGSILDIPIEATVFNYGKNGIRGEAIMRNSKIVQSMGWSGVLGGLGKGASAVSQTTSVSPQGTVSSVNAGDLGLNILGNMGTETASKLSEYYLKLAEKYHPDIDLRQGAVVNIVFLKGFPLFGDEVDKYTSNVEQARLAEKQQGASLVAVASNPLSTMTQVAGNAAKNIQGVSNEFK